MGAVNLSPARLAVLVALVVGGIAVMLNGFGDEGGAVAGGPDVAQPTETETAEPTDDATTPAPTDEPAPALEPQVDGVMIQVFNGTTVTGLGAEVQEALEGRGYVAALPADDLPTKPADTTTVYFRPGPDAEQNEVDAQHLADRSLRDVDDVPVRPLGASLDADVGPRTQLVVVVGTDYADATAAA
jgi:hypothetical protein